MRVKLGIARRQDGEQFQNVGFVHAVIFQETENSLGVANILLAKSRLREPGQDGKNRRVCGSIQPPALGEWYVHPERFACQAQVVDTELLCVRHQNSEHGRMQVEVQMAVDMIQRQARGAETRELFVDFRAKLVAQVASKEIMETDFGWVIAEFALCIDEAGNFFRRQS